MYNRLVEISALLLSNYLSVYSITMSGYFITHNFL